MLGRASTLRSSYRFGGLVLLRLCDSTPRYNGIAAAGSATYLSVVVCARLTLSRCCNGCAMPSVRVTEP
jgi:hypothetical protein